MLFHRLARGLASSFTATLILVNLFSGLNSFGQTHQVEDHLQFGEFAKAIELAEHGPDDRSDLKLAKISTAQFAAGADSAAQRSVEKILADRVRFRALAQQQFFGGPGIIGNGGGTLINGNGGGGVLQNGQGGGVTEADFQPLINLIKGTIDPDGWDDANGDGTIQAYPAGVYADSSGTLRKIKIDKNRSLSRIAKSSLADSGNRTINRFSKLRKVSLNRLEKQAQLLASQGKPIPSEMKNLAGLCEIEFLMFLPDSNDIVIAGPAGQWKYDSDGHAINAQTGKPVLQLDDLVVCLRNAQRGPNGNYGKFGCSITPRKENLAATREFISTSKLRGKAWRDQLRDVLGKQDIEVFGMDPATHAGMVLVEADYRMKLVAMGLEPSIPEIPSYLSRLTVGANGEVEPMDVVRWWFTMNYQDIESDEDQEVFELVGSGVKVLSENEFIDEQGERIHTGKSDGPTAGFARDFTRHFEKIANEYPVYRRLKNLFDLSIVSALIRSHGLNRKADWNLTYFGNDAKYGDLTYQLSTAPVPTQVESVMNHRMITRRKKSSTVKHMLVGVSGGITFDAIKVLKSKSSVTNNADELTDTLAAANQHADANHWWWD